MYSGGLSRRCTAAPRSALAAVVLVASLSLALAACGGDDDSGAGDPGAQPPSAKHSGGDNAPAQAAASEVFRSPFTGEVSESALPDRPAYVVKVDNTAGSAPQVGLSKADMVVEELVEGGSTRLAAFFYSALPELVGPVRSMRASDVGIVAPADAVIVASGGAKPTLRVLADHEVRTYTQANSGAAGYTRSSDRTAPYNLFMHLAKIGRNLGRNGAEAMSDYLPFGSDDFNGDIPTTHVVAKFSGVHTTDWRYKHDAWVRTNSNAGTDDDFEVDNVLLLRVEVGDAGYKDPAGNPVPETDFSGTGDAVLVHGDRALSCTWSKKDRSSPLALQAGDKAVQVPLGHTFIELVPSDGGSVTLGR